MPRKTAGHKYPWVTTDVKPHNHQYCPVVEIAIRRNRELGEPWGTQHVMPALRTEAHAKEAKTGFYAARYCRQLREVMGEPVSIQADIEQQGDYWVAWFRVWPRSVAKAEIARRVQAGEKLAYNVLKN